MENVQKAIKQFVIETVQGQLCQPAQPGTNARKTRAAAASDTTIQSPPKTPPKKSRLRRNAGGPQARAPRETQAVNTQPACDDREKLQLQPFVAPGGEKEHEVEHDPPCYECGKYGHRARDHPGNWTPQRRKHWEAHRALWHAIKGMRQLGMKTPAIAQALDVPWSQVSQPRNKDTLMLHTGA